MLAAYGEKFAVGRQTVVVVAFLGFAGIEQLRIAPFDGNRIDKPIAVKHECFAVRASSLAPQNADGHDIRFFVRRFRQ